MHKWLGTQGRKLLRLIISPLNVGALVPVPEYCRSTYCTTAHTPAECVHAHWQTLSVSGASGSPPSNSTALQHFIHVPVRVHSANHWQRRSHWHERLSFMAETHTGTAFVVIVVRIISHDVASGRASGAGVGANGCRG